MLDKIETLRTRPKHVRNQYAFWIALSLTAAIAFFWVLSLPSRFASAIPQDVGHTDQAGIFSRNITSIKESLVELFTSFNTHANYTKPVATPKRVDLNALIASSSIEEATNTQEMAATSTPQN